MALPPLAMATKVGSAAAGDDLQVLVGINPICFLETVTLGKELLNMIYNIRRQPGIFVVELYCKVTTLGACWSCRRAPTVSELLNMTGKPVYLRSS